MSLAPRISVPNMPARYIVSNAVTYERVRESLHDWRKFSHVMFSEDKVAAEIMARQLVEIRQYEADCGCVARVFSSTCKYQFAASPFWLVRDTNSGYLTIEIKKCAHATEIAWGYDRNMPGGFSMFAQPYFNFDAFGRH